MLVFSCHGDTNFRTHRMQKRTDGTFLGTLDNFAGVHALMKAFFSGRLSGDFVRIEITWGEERDFSGAREVLETIEATDVVVVVDVTGARTGRAFHVEKCRNRAVWEWLETILDGLDFRMYEHCEDPVSSEDEADVYVEKTPWVFFLGVPCWGGDYNAGDVSCRQESLDAAAEAICRIVEGYPAFREAQGLPL